MLSPRVANFLPVVGLFCPLLVLAPCSRKRGFKAKQAPLRSGLAASCQRVAVGTPANSRLPRFGRVAAPAVRSRLLSPPGPLSGLLPTVACRFRGAHAACAYAGPAGALAASPDPLHSVPGDRLAALREVAPGPLRVPPVAPPALSRPHAAPPLRFGASFRSGPPITTSPRLRRGIFSPLTPAGGPPDGEKKNPVVVAKRSSKFRVGPRIRKAIQSSATLRP